MIIEDLIYVSDCGLKRRKIRFTCYSQFANGCMKVESQA